MVGVEGYLRQVIGNVSRTKRSPHSPRGTSAGIAGQLGTLHTCHSGSARRRYNLGIAGVAV
ncbi:MAG: hypothetical protein WBB18_01520 [Nodosilinea sp.]